MEYILLKNILLTTSGHIYATIGAFQFDSGNFDLKYFLNDHFNTLNETNGVFGFDNDNLLKIKFESGTVWNITINNGQLSYSNRISAMHPTEDDVLLNRVTDTSSITEAIELVKQDLANDELYYNNHIRWLMSKEEIDNLVGTSTSTLESKNITYAKNTHSSYNNPYNIKETVYVLNSDQLKAYFLDFNKDSYSYSNYEKIRNLLTSKYGSPTIESFNWIDETYKNTPEKWNDAFKYSDFTIKTTWVNDNNFSIVIMWDYKKSCIVAYCEKGYENQL